jgi:hypothetical protein
MGIQTISAIRAQGSPEQSYPHACAKEGSGGCGKGPHKSGPEQLDTQEQSQVQELRQRDREVRAHEAAHVAAGGQYVRGGAHFQYQTGPDGRQYAVGGEVSIDTSPVSGNPDATIQKMRVVRRAALAPADPSPQDRAVAAAASQAETTAHQEKRTEETKEKKTASDNKKTPLKGPSGPFSANSTPSPVQSYTSMGNAITAIQDSSREFHFSLTA